MPSGLQVWDRTLRRVIDTPTYTTKYLGDATFTSDQNASISISKAPGERPFIIVFNFSNRKVTLAKADNGAQATVSFSTPGGSGFTGWFRILYGVHR